ncbi:terminase large subunit [Vibrio phage VB_VaC_TDDLMA]
MSQNEEKLADKLDELFTPEVIEHFKKNQGEITSELLETMRSFGNKGKHLALEILDIPKDEEQYYLDAFGNRMSFMGNRRLKKSFSKITLYPIHIEEIKRCSEDIHYFKDNYVKIRTKSGVNFPEMREYQNDFITELDDDSEGIIGLMGRQSGKSITTSIYLSHLYCFKNELNIGIVANKGGMAREFLSNVKNILIELPIWMVPGTKSWNKSYIEAENDMRIMTDVPGPDAFRGFSIHVAVMDETAFIRPNIWEEFIDSFLPSQAALSWKKNIILSTPKGMNHFYDLVKGASPHYESEGSGIKEPGERSNGYKLFKVDWKDVPRFNAKGQRMKPEDFMNGIIAKHGMQYWRQNFECNFLGSSSTLISAEKLSQMTSQECEEIRDGKLKIYQYPVKGHQYIMTVDAAKDGTDFFAVQVVDITDFNFKQVAAAQLQIDYLLMPEFINEWAEMYNNPYLIIENNEGAGQSIADQMRNDYEYENLHYDKDVGRNRKKKYPGFRTTPKTRKQILQTLKLFIENDKLEVVDRATIQEFFQFILINNKYQADEGAHDDMIMSLGLVFVPFCNSRNFEDMKLLVKNLYNDAELSESEKVNFGEMMTIGSFDDGTDEEYLMDQGKKEYMSMEEFMEDQEGFF